MGEAQQPGVSVVQAPVRTGWSMALWGLLALLAHLALLDAAVETFWSGSPLRWWISPALIVFAALSVYMWRPGGSLLRRLGPAGAAGTPVLGFIALLAATAWVPAGQDSGVRVFLQSTATLLIVGVAAAVLLAAIVLIRQAAVVGPTPRLALRILVAVVAAYAMAALALGVLGHTPFALLFNGAAAWQRLPRWLQGPFLGVVLLPLAVLAEGARAFVQLRRSRPVRAALTQAIALVMAFAVALSGFRLPAATGSAPTVIPAARAALDQVTAAIPTGQIRGQLVGGADWATSVRRYIAAAENELKRPGADPSDVDAKAAELSHDVGKIFQFVRDRVTLEPYVGELRGARGTLLASAGNSLDRALLAQALLKASNVGSRLVKGRLSSAQSDALFQAYLKREVLDGPLAQSAVRTEPSALATTGRDLAAKTGLNEEGVLASLRRAQAKADITSWKTDEARAAQVAFLGDQLRRANVKPGVEWRDVDRELRQRFQDHYWLQVAGRDGGWTDFDTAWPDATVGKTAGSDRVVVEALPAEARHRFEFTLVYRTKAGGEAKDEVLLTRVISASDALFDAIDFRIHPTSVNVDQLLSMDTAAQIKYTRGISRFQPILRAGNLVVPGRAFDLNGHTFDPPSGGGPSSPISGMMGGLLGFGGEAPATQFVDLRVVLRLSGPGRDATQQTRTLVRAADLKAPTFAPPLTEWEFLVQSQWIRPDFVSFHALKQLVQVAKANANTLSIPAVSPVPLQLLQVALARQMTLAQDLGKEQGIRPLIDRPLLTISTHSLQALLANEGRFVTSRTIDIVENAIRYVASDPTRQTSAFQAALRQGVADCVIEGTMLEGQMGASAGTGEAIFRRAQLEGRSVVVTTVTDTTALQAAGMTASDRDWIRTHESPSARLVVAQASDGRSAWWSVQPDGNTVLRVSGGGGQAHTEHGVIEMVHVVMTLVCGYEILSTLAKGHGGEGHEPAKQGGLDWASIHKAEFVAKRVAIAVCAVSSFVGVVGAYVVAIEGFAMVLLGLDIGVTIGEKGFELGMAGVSQLEDLGRR